LFIPSDFVLQGMGGAEARPQAPQSSLNEDLPPKLDGMMDIWQEGSGAVSATGPLSKPDSQFVLLRCERSGRWQSVEVDRSAKKRTCCVFKEGFPLTCGNSASERCRLLMQQPKAGDPTEVYFRGAGGQDPHMGHLLFIGDTLCERACLSGSAGRWERLELRPTRFRESSWCFHLWSHMSGLPVCFADRARIKRGFRGKFVVRRPENEGEMVVFSLQPFPDTESVMEAEAMLDGEYMDAQSSVDVMTSPQASAPRRVIGWVAGSTTSVVHQLFTLPLRLIPGIGMMAPQGHPQGHARWELDEGTSLQEEADDTGRMEQGNVTAFTFLGGSCIDVETGEVVNPKEVVRGTTRKETIKFKVGQDLTDVIRISKVSVFMMKFTDKIELGSYLAREEPYEFTFPEKLVQRAAPGGTYHLSISYVAANMKKPLFSEDVTFLML